MLDEKVYQHVPSRFTEEFWGSDDLSPQQPPTDCTLGVRQRDRAVRPMIARGLQTGVPEDMPRRGEANGLVPSPLPYHRIIASRDDAMFVNLDRPEERRVGEAGVGNL